MAPLGARRLLVRPDGRQFGHLALEWLMGLAEAHRSGRMVWLIRPARPANPALLSIGVQGVTVRQVPGPLRPAAGLRLGLAGLARTLRFSADAAIEALFDQLARDITFHIERSPIPEAMQRHLRLVKNGLGHRTRRPDPMPRGPYFLRRLVREALPITLSPEARRLGDTLAQRAGLPVEGPMAVVHAREAGYKQGGREVQQKATTSHKGLRDDSFRNGRIETYGPAIDLLVERGYTVVRIGDATMTPMHHAGVVDLATSEWNDPLLQVWCLYRSDLLISGESGPSAASYLTNTALLTVNATDPIGSYPVRRGSRLLLKRICTVEGSVLGPRELLSPEYLSAVRHPTHYRYQDNTPEEILAATREILDDFEVETPGQASYREAATSTAVRLSTMVPYVRKWGADEGFLGDGVLVAAQASA